MKPPSPGNRFRTAPYAHFSNTVCLRQQVAAARAEQGHGGWSNERLLNRNAEQMLLECSRCALLMPTLARKSANPGHMSPKFLRCAGCMDCASRRGRILREGGARENKGCSQVKSRPATRSSAALVRLGDAQEAPSNRRLRAAWLARVRPRWQLTSGRGSSHRWKLPARLACGLWPRVVEGVW